MCKHALTAASAVWLLVTCGCWVKSSSLSEDWALAERAGERDAVVRPEGSCFGPMIEKFLEDRDARLIGLIQLALEACSTLANEGSSRDERMDARATLAAVAWQLEMIKRTSKELGSCLKPAQSKP